MVDPLFRFDSLIGINEEDILTVERKKEANKNDFGLRKLKAKDMCK